MPLNKLCIQIFRSTCIGDFKIASKWIYLTNLTTSLVKQFFTVKYWLNAFYKSLKISTWFIIEQPWLFLISKIVKIFYHTPKCQRKLFHIFHIQNSKQWKYIIVKYIDLALLSVVMQQWHFQVRVVPFEKGCKRRLIL